MVLLGQEGGGCKPTQVDIRYGRRAVCASSVKGNGGMAMGRKGGRTSALKSILGSEGSKTEKTKPGSKGGSD